MPFLMKILTSATHIFNSYRLYIIVGGIATLVLGGGYFYKMHSQYHKGYDACALEVQQASLTKKKEIDHAKHHAENKARHCIESYGVYECLRAEVPDQRQRRWYDFTRFAHID